MGGKLSMVKVHGKRLLNRYNAQNRALDLIEYEHLPKAPRHPTNVDAGENFHDTTAASNTTSKDAKLDGYLKNIYVRSFDEMKEKSEGSKSEDPKKPLPVKKEEYDTLQHNIMFPDPTEITRGHCTLTQVTKFLATHNANPEANNAKTISEEYNLNKETVEHILKYYTVFRLFNSANNKVNKTYEQEIYEKLKSGKLKEVEEKVNKNVYLRPFIGILRSFMKENEEREKREKQLQNK